MANEIKVSSDILDELVNLDKTSFDNEVAAGLHNFSTGNDGGVLDSIGDTLAAPIVETGKLLGGLNYLATGDDTQLSRAQELSRNVYGVNQDGSTAMNDAAMITGSVLPFGTVSTGSSAVVKSAKSLAMSAMGKKAIAKNLITNKGPSTLSKVGSGVYETALASSLAPFQDSESTLENGEFKTNTEILDSPQKFAESMLMDAAGGAVIDVGVVGAYKGIKNGVVNHRLKKQYDKSEFSTFNNKETQDAIVSKINEDIINNEDAVKMLQEEGTTFDENTGTFVASDSIKFDELKQAAKDGKQPIVVSDESGRVFGFSEGTGYFEGRLDESNGIVLDHKKSNINPKFTKFKIGGERVLQFSDEGMRTLYRKKFKEAEDIEGLNKEVNPEANVYNYTTKEEATLAKEALVNKELSGNTKVDEQLSPFIEALKIDKVAKATSMVKSFFTEKINGNKSHLESVFDVLKSEVDGTKNKTRAETLNKLISTLFEVDNDGKFIRAKESLVKALETAAGEDMLLKKTEGGLDKKKTSNNSKQIFKRAIKLITKQSDFSGSGVNPEGITNNNAFNSNILYKLDNILDQSSITDEITSNYTSDLAEINQIIPDDLKDAVSRTITKMTNADKGIRLDGEGTINGLNSSRTINIPSKVGKLARKMATNKRKIDKDLFQEIKEEFETKRDKLAKQLKGLDKDSHPNVIDNQIEEIANLEREIAEIQELIDSGAETFSLDVEVGPQNRISYTGALNPHSSKILRYVQKLEGEQQFDLANADHLSAISNHINDVLDIDFPTTLEGFKKATKESLLKQLKNKPYESIEEMIVQKQAIKLVNQLKARGPKKQNISFKISADAITSNLAIYSGALGDTSNNFGTNIVEDGKSFKFNKNDSLPSRAVKIFEESGLNISRKYAKFITTPYLYMSSEFGAMESFSGSFLSEIMKKPVKERVDSLPKSFKDKINGYRQKLVNDLEKTVDPADKVFKENKDAYEKAFEIYKKKSTPKNLETLQKTRSNLIKSYKYGKEKFDDIANTKEYKAIEAYENLIETNTKLTDSKIETQMNSLTLELASDSTISSIAKRIKKEIPTEIMEFMEDLETVLQMSKAKFFDQIRKDSIDGDKLRDIANELNINETIVNDYINERGLDTGNKISIEQLIEDAGENIIDLDVKFLESSKTIDRLLDGSHIVNPFGDKISLMKIIGNQTYKSEGVNKGIVIKGINMSSIMTPIYIQSIESSIAARAYGESENVFDAVYGGAEVLTSAKKANSYMAYFMAESGLANGYNAIDSMLPVTMADEVDITDSFAKRMVEDKKKANNAKDMKATTEEIQAYQKFMGEKLSKLRETIDEKKKKVENRKAKLDPAKVKSGNFATGKMFHSSDGSGVSGIIDNAKVQIPESNNRANILKNVVVKQGDGAGQITRLFDNVYGVVNRIVNLDFHSKKSQTHIVGDTITMKLEHSLKNVKTLSDFRTTLRQLSHESVHAAREIVSSKMSDTSTLVNDFAEFIQEVTGEAINPNMIDSELLSMILEVTISNDIVLSKRETLASKFKTSNLTQLYSTTYDGINGTADLQSRFAVFVKNKYAKNKTQARLSIDELTRIVDTTATIMNNESVIDILNGIKPQTTGKLKSSLASNKVLEIAKAFAEKSAPRAAQIVESSSIFDMFTLDMTVRKEALNKIIGQEQGFINDLNNLSSEIEKVFEQLDKETFNNTQDAQRAKSVIGKMVGMGIHLFDTDKMKTVEDMKTQAEKAMNDVKEAIELVHGKDTPQSKNIYKTLMDNLMIISSGKAFGKRNGLTLDKKTRDFMKTLNMDNAYYESVKQKLEKAMAGQYLKKKLEKNKLYVADKFLEYLNDDVTSNYVSETLGMFKQHINSTNIYGVNYEINLAQTNRSVGAIRINPETRAETRSKYKSVTIGTTFDSKGREYLLVAKDKNSLVLGKQDSHVLDFDLAEHTYESGSIRKKIKGSNEVLILKPEQMRKSSSFVDMSIDKQIQRNVYLNAHKSKAYNIAKQQFIAARDNGVILTQQDVRNGNLNPDDWKRLSKEHPFSKLAGGVMYYNTKHQHLLFDTKGFDVAKFTKNFGSMNKIAFNTIRGIVDAVKMARSFILLSRTAGYVNNIVANGLQTTIHAQDLSRLPLDYKKATEIIGSFRKLLDERNALFIKDKNSKRLQEVDKLIQQHELYEAYSNNLFSTIRSDAFRTGTYGEISLISDLARYDKSGYFTTVLRNMSFDPNSIVGKTAGKVFDATEIIPKLALYLNLRDLSQKERVQYVQMAFPTYENLPPVFNAIDQFFPYTKYAMNYPKMLMFSMNRGMSSTLALNAALPTIASLSWRYDDQQDQHEFFKENGFTYIGNDIALSMNNWLMPSFADLPSKTSNVLTAPIKAFEDPLAWILLGTTMK